MSRARTHAKRRAAFRGFIGRPFVTSFAAPFSAAEFKRVARRFAAGKVVRLPPESTIVAVFQNGETYIASTHAQGGDVVRERVS